MKQEEPKQPTYELVERDSDPVLYGMLDRLVADHHDELAQADIAIAWRFGWKPDPDGRLQLGQLRKASELDRQLHAHDFVMLLNWEVWDAANFSDEQKRALIDHELSHGALALDAEYEPKENAAGKKLYRMRKHDIEEFAAVVKRHGLWKHELQYFAQVAMEAKALPLFAEEPEATVSRFPRPQGR
jgi:hypothetical protein